MTNEPEEPEAIKITLQGLASQIHTVNEALARALEILHYDDPHENELAEAIAAIEMAREMTNKLDLALFAVTIEPDS